MIPPICWHTGTGTDPDRFGQGKRHISEIFQGADPFGNDGSHGSGTGAACLRNLSCIHQRVSGDLTDHYDPRSKTLRLSDSTYGSSSVAAVCVAAHECGHAVQDQLQYGPLVLRSTLVPAANFGSTLAWPVFIAGLIFSMRPLVTVGIVLFCLAVLFQLVTLPVEFNASSRAMKFCRIPGCSHRRNWREAKKY